MAETIAVEAQHGAESQDGPDDGYHATVSRVRALSYVEDETPSPHALLSALDFLTQIGQSLGNAFPRGAAAVGDDGRIDVYWRKPGRTVQLMIPADERRTASVYHRDGTDYGVDKDAAPETLARWLEWFARA